MQSPHNTPEKIAEELDMYLNAYYVMIDECKEFPDWERKIEEELGGALAMSMQTFDQTVRN